MEPEGNSWNAWPVCWSGIWIGMLAAVAVGLIIGLIGLAVGAQEISRFVEWKKLGLTALAFNVAGAFFAFVIGAWAAARVAGIRRSEPAILHGAIVWLLALPVLLLLAALGVSSQLGGWYGALSGVPAWAAAAAPDGPEVARAMRNTAVATVVALLIGLIGAVIGGWMASGEPMTFTHHRQRDHAASRASAISDPMGSKGSRP